MQIGQPRDPMMISSELFCFLVFKINVLIPHGAETAEGTLRAHMPS